MAKTIYSYRKTVKENHLLTVLLILASNLPLNSNNVYAAPVISSSAT